MNPIVAKAYSMLLGAALAAAGVPVGPGGITSQAVVSYGHRGAVLDLAVDNRQGLVFSAGEDGTLRVWDAGAQTLVRRIAATRRTVHSVTIDPSGSRAALLVTDGKTSSIDVWDWEREALLYRIPLESTPFFVHFSLTGSYILCGSMTWDSLRVFRARDGMRIDVPSEGGMVGFAEISRSDSTLMTYQPSGRIIYRSLQSGEVLREVHTTPDLVDIHMSGDRRVLVGHTTDVIVGVDALTGDTLFSVPADGLRAEDLSEGGDRVAWIAADGGVLSWSRTDGVTTWSRAGALGWDPRALRFMGDDVLVGGEDGEISRVSAAGAPAELARDIMARTSGFAVANDGTLALAAGDLIHVFSVGGRVSERYSVLSPYTGRPVGLLFLADGRILVWPQRQGTGALGTIDPATRTFTDIPAHFTGPLAAVTQRDGRVYALETGGRIVAVDPLTGQTLFETQRPGAVCIAAVSPTAIVVGRARGGSLQSSLVRIDLETGETAAVPGSESYTYALAPDPSDGSLYSIAVDADGRTKLFHHTGPDLETESVVDATGGEYLAESLSLDPSTGVLYSSLGRLRVGAWFHGALRSLGDPSPGILVLSARSGLVASLQRDATVSLWDAAADRPVGTIFPFEDGSWAAIMADGTVQGAPDGVSKVVVFAQGELASPPSQRAPVVP